MFKYLCNIYVVVAAGGPLGACVLLCVVCCSLPMQPQGMCLNVMSLLWC